MHSQCPHSGSCCRPGGSTSSEFSRRPCGGKRQHFSDCHQLLLGLQVIWRNSRVAITLSHFCLPGGVTWFGAAPGGLIDESWAPSISIWNHPQLPRPPCTRALTGWYVRGPRGWARRHLSQRNMSARSREAQGKVSGSSGVGFPCGEGTRALEVDTGKSPASDQTA